MTNINKCPLLTSTIFPFKMIPAKLNEFFPVLDKVILKILKKQRSQLQEFYSQWLIILSRNLVKRLRNRQCETEKKNSDQNRIEAKKKKGKFRSNMVRSIYVQENIRILPPQEDPGVSQRLFLLSLGQQPPKFHHSETNKLTLEE